MQVQTMSFHLYIFETEPSKMSAHLCPGQSQGRRLCVTLMMHRIQVWFLAFMKSSYFFTALKINISAVLLSFIMLPFHGSQKDKKILEKVFYTQIV